ncbi:MAG: hypothetical protein ACKVT1_03895 [Dehalococcoidia bacterium]
MSRGGHLALVTLVAAVLFAPFLVVHPTVPHLSAAGLTDLPVELTHPVVAGVLLVALVTLLPAYCLVVVLVRAVRGSTHLHALIGNSEPAHLEEFVYRRLPSDGVSVFTAGLFRPVTFVTTGAAAVLGPARLRAALLHEEAHKRRQDLRWRLLLQAVGSGFSFIPVVSELVEAEALCAECHADESAIRSGAGRLDLFEAIVAAATSRSVPLAVGLTDTNVEFRLMRLVDPALPLPRRSPMILLGLAGLAVAPALAVHLGAIAAAAWGGTHFT